MKWVSRIAMCVATSIMLLVSAMPHHHHCSNLETNHHIDYICFADDDFDTCDSVDEADHCFGVDSECSHKHSESPCRLHLIVTLLTQIQSVQHFQSFSVVPATDSDAAAPSVGASYSSEFFVPLSERLISYYLVKSKGLRAPPAGIVW